jgi:hypothetical protein
MTSPSRDGWWGLRGVAYMAALEPFNLELLPFAFAQHATAPSAFCEVENFEM